MNWERDDMNGANNMKWERYRNRWKRQDKGGVMVGWRGGTTFILDPIVPYVCIMCHPSGLSDACKCANKPFSVINGRAAFKNPDNERKQS